VAPADATLRAGPVGDQVGVYATEAEDHQRAKRGIAVDPDQQLPAEGVVA